MKQCFLLLFLSVLLDMHMGAQNGSCAALMNADNGASRRFLEEQNAGRVSPCIPTVITRLGQARDKDAVGVLVQYLDYLDPASAPRPDGGAEIRPNYPAITALFSIGKAATPQLLLAIRDGESSKIRENAVKAYMFVYRDDLPSGIRQLKKEELTAHSADARRRLSDALQKLIDACNGRSDREATECKNAL